MPYGWSASLIIPSLHEPAWLCLEHYKIISWHGPIIPSTPHSGWHGIYTYLLPMHVHSTAFLNMHKKPCNLPQKEILDHRLIMACRLFAVTLGSRRDASSLRGHYHNQSNQMAGEHLRIIVWI